MAFQSKNLTMVLNVPINSVSFGQVCTGLLREAYSQDKDSTIVFPVGNPEFNTQSNLTKEFGDWVKSCINRAPVEHKRGNPCLRFWHLDGSLASVSESQALFTFYELDAPTPYELNTIKNQSAVIVSSNYTKQIFESFGCSNIHYVPLGFDKANFSVLSKPRPFPNQITFNLCGKIEKRKNHKAVIRAWIKKFGNQAKYRLQLAIYNPFLNNIHGDGVDYNANAAMDAIGVNPPPYNISIHPHFGTNALYNDFLNSSDIILGMSGAEGWDLPVFQSVCLGKHAVVLNAHVYKDWAGSANSVLVNPNGKIDAYDNFFFKKGMHVNQGQIFTFNEDEFIAGCEEAVKRVESGRINKAGVELQEKFTTLNVYNRCKEIISTI